MTPSSPEEIRFIHADTERRISAIHGAASAAVVAVNRLSSIIPVAKTSDDALGMAGVRLASSMQHLQEAIAGLLDGQAAQAKEGAETEKWQKRYHAVERERDALQTMLVAFKEKYEKLQKAYHEMGMAHDRKVHEIEELQLKTLDAHSRLESTLFLVDVMLREGEEEDEAAHRISETEERW